MGARPQPCPPQTCRSSGGVSFSPATRSVRAATRGTTTRTTAPLMGSGMTLSTAATTSGGSARRSDENGGCAGWTFVYDGSGTNQRQCWLKPTLVSTDCNSWASSGDVISGLGRAEPQLQGQQVEAGNSTSAHLQSANTYCSDPLDVQGPHAASCQWMKTDGDDCQNSDDDACRCRDYNTVQQRCTGCSVNPCQKRFCFDIIDLPDNNCQWMYNEGDDCTSTDENAEACRRANAHSCAPCPR